jgi:hypothetical protein
LVYNEKGLTDIIYDVCNFCQVLFCFFEYDTIRLLSTKTIDVNIIPITLACLDHSKTNATINQTKERLRNDQIGVWVIMLPLPFLGCELV